MSRTAESASVLVRRPIQNSWSRARLALLGLVALLVGCEKARSSAPPAPSFTGTWDVTFDDALGVELQIGERALTARLDGTHGLLEFRDAGNELAFELDCAAPDLVCPSEVWPAELTLHAAPGQLDADAVQLAKSLAGMGRGDCIVRPGSYLTGEVLSTPGADGKQAQAVALTSGRVTIQVDARCVAPNAGLPKGAVIQLAAGFTAARR